MWGLPIFLESNEQRRFRLRYEKEHKESMLKTVKPWSPDVKWEPELAFTAESFNTWVEQFRLFRDRAALPKRPPGARGDAFSLSPSKKFCYCVQELPARSVMKTFCGCRKGEVIFDGPINVPALLDLSYHTSSENVWMSLTPMEVMTLRPGTRKAKGHVVVAGLGLGYQLIQVSRRKKVRCISLVEKEQELIDWLLPEIKPLLGDVPMQIHIDDAHKVLPNLEAEVALVDIDRSYGSNTFHTRCPEIKTIWVWGAAPTGGSIWD